MCELPSARLLQKTLDISKFILYNRYNIYKGYEREQYCESRAAESRRMVKGGRRRARTSPGSRAGDM